MDLPPPPPSDSADPTPPSFTYVDSPRQLGHLLDSLDSVGPLALDTEADSLHHYPEKVCLIQLSAPDRHWLIDPLVGLELEPLMRVLERRELIMHGANYDLRLLERAHGFHPRRVFDTMLAAQMLGRARIGLQALVEAACGVRLSKHGQRADWSRRPLPPRLLEYAVCDTHYLGRVAENLRLELQARGRFPWHEEACARMVAEVREAARRAPVEDEWRIRGGRHYAGRPAAVLRALHAWREEEALRADRPPFKIAGNELLLRYARWAAEHPHGRLDDAPEPPEWLRGARRRKFQQALAHGLQMPAAHWPKMPERSRRPRPVRDDEPLLARILETRECIARQHELDPGVLAPREALQGLARLRPATEEALRAALPLMEWQFELLAAPLLQVLNAPELCDNRA